METDQENPDIDLFYVRNQEDGGDPNFPSVLERLEQKYSKLETDLSVVIEKKTAAKGIWIPEEKLVRITCEKHLKQFLPFTRDGQRFLHPFEALFLFECKSLALFYREVALTLEDAYNLILQDVREHKLYRVFSVLARVGYYVQNFKPKEIAPEMETKPEDQRGCKRQTDSEPESHQNKKITENFETTNDNFCVINNVRELNLGDISKLDKIDQELIKHFRAKEETEESSSSLKSHLYCIKKASRPISVNPMLAPIFQPKIKPMIPLGSIFNTVNLFETIQKQSPMIYMPPPPATRYSQEIRIDFSVFQSRKFTTTSMVPLFYVSVVDEDQPLPTIDSISSTIQNNLAESPLFFAIMSPSLNFNFYSFEILKLENKYPRLWEQ